MSSANLAAIITAVATALAVIVSVTVHRFAQRTAHSRYLETLWAQILTFTQDHPEFCDVSLTMDYLKQMEWQERLVYDSMCLNAWSIIYEASLHRTVRHGRLQLAFEWVAAFHSEWLLNNAQLFLARRFWREYESVQSHESRVTRHRPVPSMTGAINWDTLSTKYFLGVLSPFDPSLAGSSEFDKALAWSIEKIKSTKSSSSHVDVVDVGCGVGNLLNALKPYASELDLVYTGIDKSQAALDLARKRSAVMGLQSHFIHGDVRDRLLCNELVGDVVIAVNVVLGESREENRELFRAIASLLRDSESLCILVLPAYETIEHLRNLRFRYYRDHFGQKQAVRAQAAYDRWKRPNASHASYSDDGWTTQYFHSEATMCEELIAANLTLVNGPSKLYYPWDLARRFDYGYFPGNEEIWDWVAICQLSCQMAD